MKTMSKNQLMDLIDQSSFMLDDITLYLNTHPTCREAINAYKHFKQLRMDAVADYTNMYGPLNRYYVNANNYWDWVKQPWPWERECDC